MEITQELANRFYPRLMELANDYKIVCMSPVVYSLCRKLGRDVHASMVVKDYCGSPPSPTNAAGFMALRAGILGAAFSCDYWDDLPGDSSGSVPFKDIMDAMCYSEKFKTGVKWILTVSKSGLPNDSFLVAKEIGDPWETVEI